MLIVLLASFSSLIAQLSLIEPSDMSYTLHDLKHVTALMFSRAYHMHTSRASLDSFAFLECSNLQFILIVLIQLWS